MALDPAGPGTSIGRLSGDLAEDLISKGQAVRGECSGGGPSEGHHLRGPPIGALDLERKGRPRQMAWNGHGSEYLLRRTRLLSRAMHM